MKKIFTAIFKLFPPRKPKIHDAPYRWVMESTADGFFILYPVAGNNNDVIDFQIVDSNVIGATLFDTQREKLIGKKISEIVHTAYLESTMRLLHYALISSSYEKELQIPREVSKKIHWCMLKVVRIGTVLALTIRDISAIKTAENLLRTAHKMLHQSHYRLEIRVRERTAKLKKINNMLKWEVAERKHAEEALAQSHQQLRRLATHAEQIKEDERKRIAREIHDELGQNLLALRIDAVMLYTRSANHPHLNRKINAAIQHIDQTIKSVRDIINNLRPGVLDLGLYATLEWQVKEFQRRSGITCELIVEGEEVKLNDTRATALFRILQESLTNVMRHAHATHVQIKLFQLHQKIILQIHDNGIGMPNTDQRKINSFGLLGMRERVSTLGGQLSIHANQDQGTLLNISMPIDEVQLTHYS